MNTSVGSTATDQAATPSAVKAAYDRAGEAYSRADQAFTQVSNGKNAIADARSRIYFDTNTCSLIDTLVDYALNAVVSMRESLVDQTSDGQIGQKEAWHDSWHTITELMPSLKAQLENGFRKLLGVV